MIVKVKQNFSKLFGEVSIPSDKSISHRAIIFSSLSKGKSILKNFSRAKDPQSSLEVIKSLGVEVYYKDENTVEVCSSGIFTPPNTALNCGNSGTTMRLISGVLAGQNFSCELIGDASLSKRPMKRIITPLELMGAKISSQNFCAPLKIEGKKLHSISYNSPIASAQVKSCILLAGLYANGITEFFEPSLSRNHTEIMLKSMGANISTDNTKVRIEKSNLSPLEIEIFGDISSASYFIAAALLVPNSDIIIKNIGLNPTRTGILDIFIKMGAQIEFLDQHYMCGELVGDLRVQYSPNLVSCEISGDIIPSLIDEIPIICVVATQAHGKTRIKDASDLRNKESDRIICVVSQLKLLGAQIEETQDGMVIDGKTNLQGNCCLNSFCDHRLAMSFYVAGLITKGEISIENFEWVDISFPEFLNLWENIQK